MLPPHLEATNRVANYFDPDSNRVMYRVLSPAGLVVAEKIESEKVALQIACVEEMHDAFSLLLGVYDSHVSGCLYDLWGCMATLEELVLDIDGTYEKEFPGVAYHAENLIELYDLQDVINHAKVRWR